MKLLASFLSLTLVAALSAWLWFSQGTSDAEAEGVDLTAATSSVEPGVPDASPIPGDSLQAQVDSVPGLTDQHAAAFVGLQTLLDVWQNQPRSVLSDSDLLASAVRDARAKAEGEVTAKAEAEAAAKAEREAAAAEKARQEEEAKAKSTTPEAPRQVSPRPVSPDCEWDDGEWECDDDDDWDDDDDDDDWDDDDDDDDDR